MNFNAIVTILILFTGSFSNTISRANFYPVFEGNSISSMDKMITQLEKSTHQGAYLGALKMKLAGLIKGGGKKLKLFKEGRELLEAEIKKQPNNLEWIFLRLAIQEHAPKIVQYRNDLEPDRDFIYAHFESTTFDLQKIIKNYSANSTVLDESKFE